MNETISSSQINASILGERIRYAFEETQLEQVTNNRIMDELAANANYAENLQADVLSEDLYRRLMLALTEYAEVSEELQHLGNKLRYLNADLEDSIIEYKCDNAVA